MPKQQHHLHKPTAGLGPWFSCVSKWSWPACGSLDDNSCSSLQFAFHQSLRNSSHIRGLAKMTEHMFWCQDVKHVSWHTNMYTDLTDMSHDFNSSLTRTSSTSLQILSLAKEKKIKNLSSSWQERSHWVTLPHLHLWSPNSLPHSATGTPFSCLFFCCLYRRRNSYCPQCPSLISTLAELLLSFTLLLGIFPADTLISWIFLDFT